MLPATHEIFFTIPYLSPPAERTTYRKNTERDRFSNICSLGVQRSKYIWRMILSRDGEYVPKEINIKYKSDSIFADVNMSKVIKFGYDGLPGPKSSILATSCPMPKFGGEVTSKTSIDRLWNVAFSSERVDGIVVLGGVTSDERIIDYWSESSSTNPRFYDEDSFYKIKSDVEESSSCYIRYKIKIYESKNPENSKTINLWHYTNWNDGEIPGDLDEFEKFVKLFQESRKLIVHCSAGVGRTGVFAACLQALKGGLKNPAEVVRYMRAARTFMVQKPQQFDVICKFILRNCTENKVKWETNLSKETAYNLCGMPIVKED